MKSFVSLVVVLAWGAAFGCFAAAQNSAPPEGTLLPPIPPAIKSPVDTFRELLAMPSAERPSALTNRPPEVQRRLLAKLKEYESLSPNQRQLRLKVTELRWYLLPLLNKPSTNRTADLDVMPAEMRQLVNERLAQWDKLPASVQNEVRDQEATIRYFTEMETASQMVRDISLQSLTPESRSQLEAKIAEWRAFPEARRQKAIERFNQFFGLSQQEKARTLNSLSEPERRKIQRAIDSFGKLPPGDRARCIRGLDRFTGLSVEERLQFLKNAERWQAMSPDQREAWAQLVSGFPPRPPLPPGLGGPPLPPMPRAPTSRPLTTNVGLGQ